MDFKPGIVHKTNRTIKLDSLPAIVLINPRYAHNVGAAVRAAANFAHSTVIWTGDRVVIPDDKGYRLPREERMKDYEHVLMLNHQRPLDLFTDATFVAVEVRDKSENLIHFQHPDNAVYIFGPEDGSIDKGYLHLCQRFVQIPSIGCLNLGAAVNVVLYDRYSKEMS